ncbi:MAG: FtsX-like permease family protein, partial [Candidatus Methanoperedens sp.]|nr:FtsX-like permease family protein [Candidatus Methanoperedens sp.]
TEIVYAYREGAEPKAVFGLGIEETSGSFVSILQGEGLAGDTHYNNGIYSGPLKGEILLDGRASRFLGANIGDTLYVGKTLTEARNQKFKVVGLTNSLSSFSSGPMVVFYLSELQDISGNNYYDTVNLITLRLKDPSRAEETQKKLEAQYPDYTVSTNLNLLKKIVKQNFPILASAISIVALAVIMGLILVVNTVLLSLNERKNEIGILAVMGIKRRSIFMYVGFEGFLICIIGGVTGVLLSFPLAGILNMIVYKMVGFNNLVLIDYTYIYMGLAVAIFSGLLTSFLAVMQISRMNKAELLRSV